MYAGKLLRNRCSFNVLAIIGKRRFLDFGRTRVVEDAAELEAQVLEVTVGSRMLPKFLNDGLEVCQ
jgi:hypothetical protein